MGAGLHLHEDVQNLKYFRDANGVIPATDRLVLYAMQGPAVVAVFYTVEQAKAYYERNAHKELPVLYRFDATLFDK